jgi:epsilon-lactone hydrolase
MKIMLTAVLIPLVAALTAGQTSTKLDPDTASFDHDGTAHITRLIPMPTTVSAEAQQWLKQIEQEAPQAKELAEIRRHTDEWRLKDSAEARKLYAVNVEETTTAGVRTDIITPLRTAAESERRVLINLHGGGFISDSGSLIEGIPISNLAKMKVVSVYYRLAPENPFPGAVDDAVAVYKQLLKTYPSSNIGIFGTSAGAILTGEVAVKLRQLGVPLPGALGMFSTLADFSRTTDSQQLFALNGFSGNIEPQPPTGVLNQSYVGKTNPKDPVLSPLFADLNGFPPCLLVSGTRDLLLSNTSIFHLALLKAGVDSQLLVYEAMPHAFWYHFQLPETQEVLQMMANFFDQKLGK